MKPMRNSAENDPLFDLLSTHPNSPASNGSILLLRSEMLFHLRQIEWKVDRSPEGGTELQMQVHEMKLKVDWILEQLRKINFLLGN